MADKEEIRQRTDLVELIGRTVQLRKAGRNFTGLCPFHQEKTPSFHVDPAAQTFKCFGCGVGGDCFTFVERYENLSFVEAAEFLAKRAGLEFTRRGREAATERRNPLYELNAMACGYYQKQLEAHPHALQYLRSRGLNDETIRQFQLGFAPNRFDALTGFLIVRRADLKTAEQAGLIRSGSGGDHFDLFRNRVLFPIFDEMDRIVGFGGRAMGDDTPKYLNTGDTPIFTKSRLLYGISRARREIGAQGRTLLMEGYLDVIAAHQAGFTNAVATLGTALTEEHAKKLARLAPEAVLVYDGDAAGIKATLRAGELLEQAEIRVRVAALPPGEDPDSLLRSGRHDLFAKCLRESVGRIEYLLDRVTADTDQTTADGRALLLRKIVAVLATVPSASERDIYMERVWRFHPAAAHSPTQAKQQMHADILAFLERRGTKTSPREAAVSQTGHRRDRWQTTSPQQPAPPASGPAKPAPPPRISAVERAERELVLALADPVWREKVLDFVKQEDFTTPAAQHAYHFASIYRERLRTSGMSFQTLVRMEADAESAEQVLNLLQDSMAIVEKQSVSETLEEQLGSMTDAVLQQCAATLRRHQLELLKQKISPLLEGKSEISGEQDRRLVAEYHRLLKQLRAG